MEYPPPGASFRTHHQKQISPPPSNRETQLPLCKSPFQLTNISFSTNKTKHNSWWLWDLTFRHNTNTIKTLHIIFLSYWHNLHTLHVLDQCFPTRTFNKGIGNVRWTTATARVSDFDDTKHLLKLALVDIYQHLNTQTPWSWAPKENILIDWNSCILYAFSWQQFSSNWIALPTIKFYCCECCRKNVFLWIWQIILGVPPRKKIGKPCSILYIL